MLDLAADLPVLRLRFLLEPGRGFSPPPFPGSMFRGAFGHALIALCCRRRDQDCRTCDGVEACGYATVFGPVRAEDGGRGAGPADLPPRFVLGWDLDPANPHHPFHLDITLLGPGASRAEDVAAAVIRMCAGGLGADRARCEIREAWSLGPDSERLPPPVRVSRLSEMLPRITASDRVVVTLETPLRLKARGDWLTRPGFDDLLRAADRRLRLLASLPSQRWSPPADLELIRFEPAGLRWVEWERASSRQKAFHAQGGLLGSLAIAGPLGRHIDVLRAAAVVHLGKGTSFGLGRIRVEPNQ